VKFVENDHGEFAKVAVLLQHAGEDAFGDDFNAGVAADFGIQARAIAYSSAYGLAEQLGHAGGYGAGGDAAWL